MLDHLEKEWDVYAEIAPFRSIAARVALLQRWAPSRIEHILPSITLAGDGPTIDSVFVTGDEWIAEMKSGPGANFDYSARWPLFVYRIQLGKNVIEREATKSLTYFTANVSIMHTKLSGIAGVESTATFVSTRPGAVNRWLQHCDEFFQLRATLHTSSPPRARTLLPTDELDALVAEEASLSVSAAPLISSPQSSGSHDDQ